MSVSEAAYTTYQRALDFLRMRKKAYILAFPNPENSEVLKDLAKFCRAGDTPFHPNQRLNDVLIGRQEVWLRIQRHLKLQPDQLYKIYSGPSNLMPQTKE